MKINRFRLYLLFGVTWICPQIIIIYMPEQIQNILLLVPLILIGWAIYFEKGLDNFLLEKGRNK